MSLKSSSNTFRRPFLVRVWFNTEVCNRLPLGHVQFLSVDNLQHSLFSNVGWRSTSQKSSDDTFRRLLSGSVVLMDKIRGKTPQSGCETKRITSKKFRS